MNFVSYLLEKNRDHEKLFILGNHGTLTYAEFVRGLKNVSSVLSRRYGSRKKILLMADNTPFFIISYLSIIYSGNIAILVETKISKTDLNQIRTTSSLSGALVEDKYLQYFENSPFDIMSENILQEGGDTEVLPTPASVHGDDLAVIIFTSGSTGTKKGVMLTHKNLIANTGSIIEYLGLNETDRMCVVLPFFYCYGASLLHTHLRAGGSIVLNQNPFLGSVIKDIDTYQCTGFAGVPSTYQILINKTRFLQHKLPSLRYFTQAGGQLPNRYIKILTEYFPEKKFYVMYGATEATARLSYLDPELINTKMGSIGKGIPGVTLAVLNQAMQAVKPSEIGEIVAKGDNIMKGYYNDPEGTGSVLKNGWLYTGDLATVDDEGFIFVVGRSKNIIKSGGYRISPAEIENEILSLEKFKGCVIFGIPDEIMGEAVVAVIQVSDMRNQPDLSREVVAHCNKKLPSYKVPKKIFFVDEFPLNSSNKIDIAALKEMVLSRKT
ncbi:MAG: AMP-binding protein [Methanoregula sp.]|jgi:acyl-CoA synthetase (AMP-forming)/AMP-acid ligase II|nr:AMP-binding protein [Methanoregula sp.]